jgi:hypothetical protein
VVGESRLNKHIQYLGYLIRHKWYVFKKCCEYGIPLRGIIHDWHKFLPSEWGPYVEHFYGKNVDRDEDEVFDFAWLQHQKRARHHWQWWVMRKDSGTEKIFPMSVGARKEMLADWYGAGMALGKPDTQAWYEENKDKIMLHPYTRVWVELQLEDGL